MNLPTPQPFPTNLDAYKALAHSLRDQGRVGTAPGVTISYGDAVLILIAEVERLRQVIAERDEEEYERWERAE